jgi:serine/threonine protein kinase
MNLCSLESPLLAISRNYLSLWRHFSPLISQSSCITQLFKRSLHIQEPIVLQGNLAAQSAIALPGNRTLKALELIGKGGFNNIYKGEITTSIEIKQVSVRMARWPQMNEKELHLKGQEYLDKQQQVTRKYMEQQFHFFNYFRKFDLKHVDCKLIEPIIIETQDGISTIRPLMAGDLINYLPKISTLHDLLKILSQSCEGLDELHTTSKVSHNDVKPTNVFIDYQGKALLGDLDLANYMFRMWGGKGTSEFSDPGWDVREPLTTAFDIYSIGRTILAVLKERQWTGPEEIFQETVALANLSTQPIREKRPSARELADRLYMLSEHL